MNNRSKPARRRPDEWTPTPSVGDHSGTPLVSGRCFFVPPPPEIGTIQSAFSALRAGKSPHPARTRRRIAFVLTLVAIVLAFIAAINPDNKTIGDYLSFVAILAVVFSIVLALIPFLILSVLRKDYRCDYVGTEGLAVFSVDEMDAGKPGHVLQFSKAGALNETTSPVMLRGVIQAATSYKYSWVDASNKELFAISGEYYSENPPPQDKLHFAMAAKAAWLKYLMTQGRDTSDSVKPDFDVTLSRNTATEE